MRCVCKFCGEVSAWNDVCVPCLIKSSEAVQNAGITNPEALPDLVKNYRRMLHLLSKFRPVITYGDIISNDDLIAATGINPWCINEGMTSSDKEYDISSLIGDWKETLNQTTQKEQ